MGNYRLELIILGLLTYLIINSDDRSSLRSVNKNQFKHPSKFWSAK